MGGCVTEINCCLKADKNESDSIRGAFAGNLNFRAHLGKTKVGVTEKEGTDFPYSPLLMSSLSHSEILLTSIAPPIRDMA